MTQVPGSDDSASSRDAGAGSAYRPGPRRAANYGRRRLLRTRLLRATLLLILIVGLGGLTSLFLEGRQEVPEPVTTAADVETPDARVEDETAQLSAEQFESTLEREGVEVFRIRGARTSSDDRGNVVLREVEVDYPQGEDQYRLQADGATYNEATNATHLEGSVALEGTNGLSVDTDWMDLAAGGMVLTAADDSRFEFEGVTARGDGLRMDFGSETATLGGGVRIGGTPAIGEDSEATQPLSLTSERLVYQWGAGTIRAVGGTRLEFGDLELEARALTLAQGAGGSLGRLEARGEILLEAPLTGDGDSPDGVEPEVSSTLVLRGDALDVDFDQDQFPSQVLLSRSPGRGPAVLRVDYADGGQERLRAELIALRLEAGVLADFDSRGHVELHQRVGGRAQPLRESASATAEGRFDANGALTELTLAGGVSLADRSGAPIQARADRAAIDAGLGRVDLVGEPVTLVHSEGELKAATVALDQDTACSRASGEVLMTFVGGDAAEGPAAPFGGVAGDGASTIRSDEAWLCEHGESRFQGGVEFRSGSDVLAAAQIRISEDRRQMVANGDVATTIVARTAFVPAASGEREAEDAAEEWRIEAARLNYERDGGELRYTGDARALLGEQSLRCDELTVEAWSSGGASAVPEEFEPRTLHCLGNATLEDVMQGSSVEADRASYRFADRLVRLFGDVVVRGQADEVRGPSLVYWLDEGRYEMGPARTVAAGAGNP